MHIGERGPASQPATVQSWANDLVDRIERGPKYACLVPGSGGRFEIEDVRSAVFGRFESVSSCASLPTRELLSALVRDIGRRPVLVPTFSRGTRAAIFLPRGFDVSRDRPYPVVALVPGRADHSIRHALLRSNLATHVETLLENYGLGSSIVVLPEVDKPFYAGVSANRGMNALHADVLRDVAGTFNGETDIRAAFRLEGDGNHFVPLSNTPTSTEAHCSAANNSPSKDVLSASITPPIWGGFFVGGFQASAPLPPKREIDLENLESMMGAVLACAPEKLECVLPEAVELPTRDCPLPARSELARLRGRERPTLLVARSLSTELENKNDTRYALVLPPGFDVERSARYKIETVEIPHGIGFEAALKNLAESSTFVPETVLVVPEVERPEDAQQVVNDFILDRLWKDFNIDFGQHALRTLGTDSDRWKEALETHPATPTQFDSPLVVQKGSFARFPPTRNWLQSFPEPTKGDSDVEIPTEMQRQPDDRGTFFALATPKETSSVTVGMLGSWSTSASRFGVYLPPGYDPDGTHRYPILILLPGSGNPLHYWTSAGQLVPHLNRMMTGDASKMIVAIPAERTTKCVGELIEHVSSKLLGDPDRISLAGYSAAAWTLSDQVKSLGDRLKAVSLHAPAAASTVLKDTPDGLRMYVDTGTDDRCMRDAVCLGRRLRERDPNTEVHVFSSKSQPLGHRWAAWEQFLDRLLAFHQVSHGGKAGEPRVPPDIEDIGETALADASIQSVSFWGGAGTYGGGDGSYYDDY